MNHLINEDDKIDYSLNNEEVEYLHSVGFDSWDGATDHSRFGMTHDFKDGARLATYKTQDKYVLIYYPFETSNQFSNKTKQIFDSFEDMIDFMEA